MGKKLKDILSRIDMKERFQKFMKSSQTKKFLSDQRDHLKMKW